MKTVEPVLTKDLNRKKIKNFKNFKIKPWIGFVSKAINIRFMQRNDLEFLFRHTKKERKKIDHC